MSANDRQEGGDHYQQFSIQHWDYAWDHHYDQFQYCITKYVDRHKFKNGIEDLLKAQHHLEKYIECIRAQDEDLLRASLGAVRDYYNVNPDTDQIPPFLRPQAD